MKIRCLIVDDEQLARELLEDYVGKLPNLEVVKKCKNSMEALECLQEQKIDLIFLDIQMPDLTGVELLKTMNQNPVVIFTTAYSEYALEGYQLDVVDYLLKPFSFERFVQAINKAVDLLNLRSHPAKLNSGADPGKFITVKGDRKIYKIRLSDIRYIEGLKEYVSYYTETERIIILQSLKSLEELLPSNQFIRIHKSYIASIERIRSVENNKIVIGDQRLPLGKSYKNEVMKRVFHVG